MGLAIVPVGNVMTAYEEILRDLPVVGYTNTQFSWNISITHGSMDDTPFNHGMSMGTLWLNRIGQTTIGNHSTVD